MADLLPFGKIHTVRKDLSDALHCQRQIDPGLPPGVGRHLDLFSPKKAHSHASFSILLFSPGARADMRPGAVVESLFRCLQP